MNTMRTLYPGQAGSKKWIKKFGKSLTCIRYKYDALNNKKMITVELIVDEQKW